MGNVRKRTVFITYSAYLVPFPVHIASSIHMYTHMCMYKHSVFILRVFNMVDWHIFIETKFRSSEWKSVVVNLHHAFFNVRIPFNCNWLLSPQSICKSAPLMDCFLCSLPLGVTSIMCYGIYTVDADGGYIEERMKYPKGRGKTRTR